MLGGLFLVELSQVLYFIWCLSLGVAFPKVLMRSFSASDSTSFPTPGKFFVETILLNSPQPKYDQSAPPTDRPEPAKAPSSEPSIPTHLSNSINTFLNQLQEEQQQHHQNLQTRIEQNQKKILKKLKHHKKRQEAILSGFDTVLQAMHASNEFHRKMNLHLSNLPPLPEFPQTVLRPSRPDSDSSSSYSS